MSQSHNTKRIFSVIRLLRFLHPLPLHRNHLRTVLLTFLTIHDLGKDGRPISACAGHNNSRRVVSQALWRSLHYNSVQSPSIHSSSAGFLFGFHEFNLPMVIVTNKKPSSSQGMSVTKYHQYMVLDYRMPLTSARTPLLFWAT